MATRTLSDPARIVDSSNVLSQWSQSATAILVVTVMCCIPAAWADRPQLASGFPDFGWMVSPHDYAKTYSHQPLFRLKTDYPTIPPTQLPKLFELDFTSDPLAYLEAVRDYAFEGNVPAFGGGGTEWDPFQNNVRGWYHIPWLHPPMGVYPPDGGTEGFRGLVKEAQIEPYQLAATQAGDYQVYAITLVNAFAGYTLGEMWHNPDAPDPGATDRRFGGGFLPGTVFAKLLFTDAPAEPGQSPRFANDHVPFLRNGVEWQAYITSQWCEQAAPNDACSGKREVKTVRLLQMDVMVRDPRPAALTGWVFGTFAYNGAVGNPSSKFLNLVPLGVQWGNEPSKTRNRTNPYPPIAISKAINPELTQQKVFSMKHTPPQHLGWNGRLNGPADLNTSSCMSCHSVAMYPALVSLVADGMMDAGASKPPPQGGSKAWMEWFQNVPWGTSLDKRAYSTDMSLQVAMSLTNFFNNKGANAQGLWADDFIALPVPISRGGHPKTDKSDEHGKK